MRRSKRAWTKNRGGGFPVRVAPQGGSYKVAIPFSSGGPLRAATKIALFDQTLSPSLPQKIREGDFVLFGKPVEGYASRDLNDVKTYSKGFVLRITKP